MLFSYILCSWPVASVKINIGSDHQSYSVLLVKSQKRWIIVPITDHCVGSFTSFVWPTTFITRITTTVWGQTASLAAGITGWISWIIWWLLWVPTDPKPVVALCEVKVVFRRRAFPVLSTCFLPKKTQVLVIPRSTWLYSNANRSVIGSTFQNTCFQPKQEI